jgi:carbamoyltransferase
MKARVNDRVKHRQWFRPFAPSFLRESVSDYFVRDDDSPYMGIVLKFKDDAAKRVPAVVHFDGSARLQTVTRDSGWYYDFIKKWNEVSGVPVVLNTSFNDREPICETPEHALRCFLGTEIDYLYFPEFSILVSRRQ